MTDSQTIVSTHELYRFYPQGGERVAVLKDVSFDVREGEFVCIMGPSGSGKSTLLHVISGLDQPSAGRVILAGENLEDLSERLPALLAGLGRGDRLTALPHQLSGGEMQRVSIARALAGGQPLLLCDEPTGNLSQKAGLEVMQILRRVCDEEGRSVLLVTHNPRDAAFADRVLFVVDGELVSDVELTGPDIPVEKIHEALAAHAI